MWDYVFIMGKPDEKRKEKLVSQMRGSKLFESAIPCMNGVKCQIWHDDGIEVFFERCEPAAFDRAAGFIAGRLRRERSNAVFPFKGKTACGGIECGLISRDGVERFEVDDDCFSRKAEAKFRSLSAA